MAQHQQSTFFTSSPTLPSRHVDFVQDVAFDHYGRRIATCSGDRTVRVWDLDDAGRWTSAGSEWQAHRGSVTRLSWAHPEFGQLLATCGSDHAATIWEEREGGSYSGGDVAHNPHGGPGQAQGQGQGSANGSGTTRWVAKAQLTDARKAVCCVAFAPRHLGLKIATGSVDGLVRIYEAIDVMNLNHWPMQGSIDVDNEPVLQSESSVGAGGGEQVSKSKDGTRSGELGVAGLAWCAGRFEPPTLVVGGSSGSVGIYRYSDASRVWHAVLKLPGHAGGVLDVSWAPNVGRSYHLVASAGKDNSLRVHRLKRCRQQKQGQRRQGHGISASSADRAGFTSLELESSNVLDTGVMEVWRCAWNVTGTVLATSGDGGIVQLWKSDFRNKWACVSEVHGDVLSSPSGAVAGANATASTAAAASISL